MKPQLYYENVPGFGRFIWPVYLAMIVSTDIHVFYRSVFSLSKTSEGILKDFFIFIFFLSANADCVFTECELANINNKDDRHKQVT